ncbi:MAG: hypothetical protein WC878_03710 [Candidatus Paceibacterota bacterium]|jgi:hypothetical protein
MLIYRVALKECAKSGTYVGEPVSFLNKNPQTTDAILKELLDEQMMRYHGHASVYGIKDGALTLESKRVIPTTKINGYGLSDSDFENTLTEVDRADLREKGMLRDNTPDLEKIEKTKKAVIEFFAEEDRKENQTLIPFLKTFWWFFALYLFLMLLRWTGLGLL